MDLLKGILQEKGAELVSQLTGQIGFSRDQAERFVPEAGSAVVDSIKGQAAELDLENLTSAENVQALMGGIDAGSLASKVGIPASLSESGLKALVPSLLGFIGAKAGGSGLTSLLGGMGKLGGASEAIGKLGGMLGR